jgi:hypothetical protein
LASFKEDPNFGMKCVTAVPGFRKKEYELNLGRITMNKERFFGERKDNHIGDLVPS